MHSFGHGLLKLDSGAISCVRKPKMKPCAMASLSFLVFLAISALHCSADSGPLQDTCPTAPQAERSVFMNGFPCKNPGTIVPSDFKTSLLNHAGDLNNNVLSSLNIVTAAEFPGLNTLGLALGRTDIAVGGAVLPHLHPRASEMVYVSHGAVVAGFVDTKGRLFQQTLGDGEVFIFPRALPHYCFNAGSGLATIYSVFNSQNPGVVGSAGALLLADSAMAESLVERMRSLRAMNMSEDSLEISIQ